MWKMFTCLRSAIVFVAVTLVAAPESFALNKSGKKETLRVLYWNIQNGMWAGQPDKYDAFVEWIKSQDPDICIFAEAAQIYYDGTNVQMPNEERYPIDSIYVVKGHEPDTVVVNYSGWYQVRVEGVKKPVNIVTVHLKNARYGYNVPKERRQESADNYEGEQHRIKEVTCILDHTVRRTKNPDKEIWIMAGDFNSYSSKDNYTYKWNDVDKAFQTQDYMTLQSPFFDLVSEYYPDVFMPTCGNLRIDYMYVSKPVLRACTNVIAQPDSYTKRVNSGVDKFYIPSDHYPIIAEFKISKLK